MSVIIRSGNWHYRFNCARHIYSGRCIGCNTEKEALEYEADMRKKVSEIRTVKKVKAVIENYRDELYGAKSLPIVGMLNIMHKVNSLDGCSESQKGFRVSVLSDFIAFMKSEHGDVDSARNVTRQQAEEYLDYIVANGRFVKSRGKNLAICRETARKYRKAMSWFYSVLAKRMYAEDNPFKYADVHGADTRSETSREIFNDEEIEVIMKKAKDDPFAGPLFIIAAATGLTEGDICTLKWSEIFLDSRIICRKRRKTGVDLMIPVSASLGDYLKSLPSFGGNCEYVLPEQANEYISHRNSVSNKVTAFIQSCGIDKCAKREGHISVSRKDLHSMRHVFCYNAGKAGIPLPVVQSIVGHMTPDMTRHYMAHATMRDRIDAIDRMPDIISKA